MNVSKHIFFIIGVTLCLGTSIINCSSKEEHQPTPKEEHQPTPEEQTKKDSDMENKKKHSMTTGEFGQYMNNEIDKRGKAIKNECPIPYNTIFDTNACLALGGMAGLWVYTVSSLTISNLKHLGIHKKSEPIQKMTRACKDMEKKSLDLMSGETSSPKKEGTVTVRNIAFHQKSAREHGAAFVVWLVKRAVILSSVLGVTWILNKYVLPQSVKDRLSYYDDKITSPFFNTIEWFSNWRKSGNPITR